MPSAKALSSYVGSETMARISPFWGFMTMNTPRLRPAAFMPHSSAFSASRWMSRSMVSCSEAPAWGSCERLEHAHDATGSVTLDLLEAVLAAQLPLERGFDALLADGVVGEVAVALERLVLVGGDVAGPAHDVGDERAVQVVPTGDHVHRHARQPQVLLGDDAGDPGRHLLGDDDRVVRASRRCGRWPRRCRLSGRSSRSARRRTTASRIRNGISPGRTRTTKMGTFSTSLRPLRSSTRPRVTGTDWVPWRCCDRQALVSDRSP